MVSWKYAQLAASRVCEDMAMHHHRSISRKLVQKIGSEVGLIAWDKEMEWSYDLPELKEVVKCVAISRDGTTTPIIGQGYRETMCGTISLYNKTGDRLHTIYKACAPEKGKEGFDRVMNKEVEEIKALFPSAKYVGLADGAANNWTYLNGCTTEQVLDFYHATEHLSEVSVAMEPNEERRKKWLDEACHDLKHRPKAAVFLFRELQAKQKEYGEHPPQVLLDNLTYLSNNLKRMDYCRFLKNGFPIGSGVTEAACKVLAKQRLSGSGMRWHLHKVQDMLLIRELVCTRGRWEQFWAFYDQIRA
ncbi:hypothetical protein Halhy_0891 [Haliscomenobacter hydrossis DSM 1100]|uniref:ISKra4 family transposase n=2 Tax=Haliscomenobacter TaxID=2349 RepID=F4KV01_HALH1|nr:hypothetical protein Halhy_0265 [Haliscomenobacter hydrossis DSM 1100]AEE48795.1 hypothetical protein Halhy_0891 [Haliscomenobacter hydrossis DSM 1100]